MKILVAEYAVGGGEESESLLREGKAMLSTLKAGVERMGHEVVYPEAEADFGAAVERLSKESDAGIVIAPDEELYSLTRLLESNTANLGCPSEFVKICTDKLHTSELLRAEGIPVPRVVAVEEVETANETWYVSKPRYGCASEGVFILKGNNSHEVLSSYERSDYIITEFIRGEDISSSVIAGKTSVLPLTINKQFIRADGERLRYEGGYVPYSRGQEVDREIMSISEQVVTTLHGAGYVGIDFVLAEDERKAYVVDVNPRPTTSIVGIAKVLKNYEVADLMLRAKFGTLPAAEGVKTEGHFVVNLA
jgi:predicted ATP-grasp superfamily ATP-dependent carboligase